MSEQIDTNSSEDLDDIFKNLAEGVDQNERDKANHKGGSFNRTYEQVKYVGMEPQKHRVFRAYGTAPDFNISNIKNPKTGPHDARVVQTAEVLNDKGKRIKLVLPLEGQDNNHILWRIINKVLEGDWEKVKGEDGKEKNILKPRHMAKYPSMVGQILYSNLNTDNPARKFGLMGKGWKGKQFFMLQGIDRQSYTWHQENKHLAVLSKQVNIKKTDDGKILEFADPGVPAYGFTGMLANIMGTYGYWGNYDFGFMRTGLTTPAYHVFNASKTPEVIKDKALQAMVSTNKGFTEEELTWEKYDFDKLFKVSSATKILNNFKDYLTIVDANLGTHFINELTSLSEIEKKAWDEAKEQHDNDEGEETTTVEDAPVPLPEKPKALIVEDRAEVDIKFQLPHWSKLTKPNKDNIDSATQDGNLWSIKYKEGVRARSLCVECETRIPTDFKFCPVCGTDQEAEEPAF